MTDKALFRMLLIQSLTGAALGGLFLGALLFLDFQRVSEIVLNTAAPWTTAIILVVGCCVNFAFGAALTGFHFAIMDSNPDRQS